MPEVSKNTNMIGGGIGLDFSPLFLQYEKYGKGDDIARKFKELSEYTMRRSNASALHL